LFPSKYEAVVRLIQETQNARVEARRSTQDSIYLWTRTFLGPREFHGISMHSRMAQAVAGARRHTRSK